MEKIKNQQGNHHCFNSHNTNDENSYFIGEPDHWQIEGVAHYDGTDKFLFTPSEPVALPLTRFRAMGLAQQHFDGTFDFIRRQGSGRSRNSSENSPTADSPRPRTEPYSSP